MQRGEVRYAEAGEHHIAFREYVGDPDGEHEIVMVNGAFWPMDMLPDDPVALRLIEGLASLGRLIMFDRRGIALSDPVTDWKMPLREQWAEDLAAVIQAAGYEKPTVFDWVANSAIARSCSVRYPGLIGRLVLLNPATEITEDDFAWLGRYVEHARSVREGEWRDSPNPLSSLQRLDDPTFRELNDAAGRAGASPSQAKRIQQRLLEDGNFDDSLVDTPTLVISRSHSSDVVPYEWFRRGARTIPGAQHVDLGEGDSMVMGLGVDDLLAAITEYLTGKAHLPPPERHLAAILFTDLVDSTRRAASAGDADWKRLLDRHDAVNRTEVARRGGEVVKTTGDGVLALLPSATAAIAAASDIRHRLCDESLEIRVGVHVGEIDRRGADVSGLAVNAAARVMSSAAAGQILVSPVVTQVAGAGSTRFESVGERELKGIDGPWELFEVTQQ